MGQFLLLPAKMLLLFSCLAATAFASPLQFERVPSLDNRIPLLVQDRVPNPCLTKANDTCIFPFTYNGVEYFRCTYADSPTPWCATMVDPNNTVVANRWGGTAPPPSSQTAPRTPLTFPPAQQSQEPPASSPSATWASPTAPALPLTSSPRPGALPAHMRMEPIFLALSLSALPHALVPQLQPQQPPLLPQPQQLLLPPPPQCPPQPPPPPPQQPPPPPRPPQLQQT